MKTKINYGTPEAEGVPITEQSFSQGQRSPAGAPPIPQDTFVPGVGVLGVDIGGFAKGDMLAQEFRLNEHKDARAEESLGIKKAELGVAIDYLKIAQEDLGIRKETLKMDQEKFGWMREDKEQQEILKAGMQQAAEQGGYEGVISFLKTSDPIQAIAFHAEKLKLDAAIMGNDVMKAVQPNEINKAKLEAYGILGKMGQGILNADPADREAMFKQMSPILQKVLGEGAPKTLKEAVPMYMLAVSQSTPNNAMFGAQKMQSEVGKLNADIESYVQAGKTPENDPALKALVDKRNQLGEQSKIAAVSAANALLRSESMKTQTKSTIFRNTNTVQKILTSSSSDFIKYMDHYSSIVGNLEVLEKDPTNPAAQGQFAMAMASAVQTGIVTEPDFENDVKSNAGFKKIIDNHLAEWQSGKKVKLAADEISYLSTTFKAISKAKLTRQKIIEDQFKASQEGNGDVINKEGITYPSFQYEQMAKKPMLEKIIQKYELGNYAPELQQRGAKAIDDGKDPQAVRQLLDKLSKEASQNANQ